MKKLMDYINKILYLSGIFFLITMAVSVNMQIFTRTFIGKALTWTEEVSQFLLIGMVFLGTGLVESNNAHIKVEFIYNKFPQLQKILTVISKILTFAYIMYLLYSEKLSYPNVLNIKSKAAQIPLYWIHIVIIFGCITWLVNLIYSLFKCPQAAEEDI